MSNLLYISESTIPSGRANSIHVMKMCGGFAQHIPVTLCCIPGATYPNIHTIFDHYGVTTRFKIKRLGFFRKAVNVYFYGILVLFYVFRHKQPETLIFSRSIVCSFFLIFFGFNLAHEAHSLHQNHRLIGWLEKKIFTSKNCTRIIVITTSLKNALLSTFKIPEHKLLVLPDAAAVTSNTPLSTFPLKGTMQSLKVGYLGSMHKGKGMEILSLLSQKLPKETTLHIVGGDAAEIEYWRQKCDTNSTYFYGQVAHKETANYIRAFDICLLPNQKSIYTGKGGNNIGSFTSPLKMFEYMAQRKPIIASDIPVLKEVLNNQNAILVAPDDVNAWVAAIEKLKDENLRNKLGNRAYQDFIENYTWEKRAYKILA